MSDRMSVGQARAWIENGWDVNHHYMARGAFRTVVAQAEQIERLQNALNELEGWGMNVLALITDVGIILPGYMEPPA